MLITPLILVISLSLRPLPVSATDFCFLICLHVGCSSFTHSLNMSVVQSFDSICFSLSKFFPGAISSKIIISYRLKLVHKKMGERCVHKTGIYFSFIWQVGHPELVQRLKDIKADVCWAFLHGRSQSGCCSSRYSSITRMAKGWELLVCHPS